MHEILKDTKMVVFDIMGVILSNPSLVRKGLYSLYKEKYSYGYIKKLYDEVRSNSEGDASLWNALGEKDHDVARERFLNTYELEEGFEDIRKYLRENGMKMSILSNMPKEWGKFFYKKFNLSDDFNPMVFSGKIGVSKPDHGKYIEFLNRTDVPSSKMLFIDDKLENLKRASLVGMKTVYFKRIEDEVVDFNPDYTITSFSELM